MATISLPDTPRVVNAQRAGILEAILINVFEDPNDFEQYLRENPDILGCVCLWKRDTEEHVHRYLKVSLELDDERGIRNVMNYAFEHDDISLLEQIKERNVADKSLYHLIVSKVIQHGYVDMLLHLIHRGLDVNARHNLVSILNYACQYNKIDLVRVLLEHGANPNDGCDKYSGEAKYYTTSLQKALVKSCVGILDLLICFGVDLYSHPDLMWLSVMCSRDTEKIQRLHDMNVPMPPKIFEMIETSCGVSLEDPVTNLISSFLQDKENNSPSPRSQEQQ